ncbi:Thioredoxin reductase [compost metagenome]
MIIATGATAKWLGLESEQKYNGFGVSACAVCDGFFFKNQEVAIVGAGDTAAEEATYLAKLCSKVHMLVRRDEFRASKAMVHRVMNTSNIEVHYNSEAKEVLGDGQVVTGIRVINNKDQSEKDLEVTGFFVAIGHKPNTELFTGVLEMDETGYLITKPDSTATNIPGVFACGDVQDNIFRQAITAAGTGCMAALEAERYLAAKESGE